MTRVSADNLVITKVRRDNPTMASVYSINNAKILTLNNVCSHISNLALHNFRNHKALSLNCDTKFVLILGKNATGKTNILEAVSMLSAGRGFRNPKNIDVVTDFNKDLVEWAVRINYSHVEASHKILLGCQFSNAFPNGKKVMKINEQELKRKSDILDVLRVIWLTPKMESLFLEPTNIQRKFLDRMTFNFFPEHAKQVTEYEYFLRSRSKILSLSSIEWNQNWLKQIESKIADLSIQIINNRMDCIKMINSFLNGFNTSYLKPLICLQGEIEDMLKAEQVSAVKELVANTLIKNRVHDAKFKRCSIGAHKSEVIVINREKNRVANLCSTGEQKSMIIALLIGQAYAIYNHSKISPILLLDEIFAHLDSSRKEKLILELRQTPSQIWISSTDANLSEIVGNCTKLTL